MKKQDPPEPVEAARVALAVNIKRLMSDSVVLNTQERLGKAAGVAPKSISNMVTPARANPTIENVAKVAAAFGIEAWQLLHPELPGRALKPSEAALYEALRKAIDALAAAKK